MTTQIRLAMSEDAPAVHEIYAPIVAETSISFEVDPPSTPEIRERIERTTAEYPWLVLERDETVIGYALAGAHASRAAYQWTVDVSAYVRDAHRGEGVGGALYTALFDILRHQGFVTACAVIALPNAASVSFHEAHGFEPIGVFERIGYKHGSWRDVGWWQRDIQEPPTDPDPPTPLPEIVDSDAWTATLESGISRFDE